MADGGAIGARLRALAPAAGFLSSCVVAVAACSHEYSHRGTWLWRPVDAVGSWVGGLGRPLLFVGLCGLLLAWWVLKPRAADVEVSGAEDAADETGLSWWTALLWALPLLLVPPVLTSDPFFYADIGWMVHLGLDLDTTPVGLNGGPYAASADPFWVGIVSVYPPLAVTAAHLGVAATGFDPWWGVLAQRGMTLLGLGVAVWAVSRLGARLGVPRRELMWWLPLNPLLVLHLVGGAHNDGMMIGVTTAALLLAHRYGHHWWVTWLVAPLLIGVAMMFKPQAAVALLPVMLWPVAAHLRAWRPGDLARATVRVLGGVLVAVLAVIGISALMGRTLGWIGQILENGSSPTFGPVLIVSEILLRGSTAIGRPVGWSVTGAGLVTGAVALALCAYLFASRPDRPLEMAAWTAVVVPAASAIAAPWHFTLAVVLLALLGPTRGRDTAALLLSGYLVAAGLLHALGQTGERLILTMAVAVALLWWLDRLLTPSVASEQVRV